MKTTLKGYLIVNKFLENERFEILYEMLISAFKKQDIILIKKTNDEFIKKINESIDFILFWDKDVLLAEYLENLGYKVFNCSTAIAICDDKAKTYLALQKENIKMPKTILCPFTFSSIEYNDFSFIDDVISELGLPLILKENQGSFGNQVYLLHNKEEIIKKVRKIKTQMIFQEFISSSFGKDVRIEVVGGEAIGSVLRTGKENDFRSNVLAGGTMHKFEAPSEFLQMSEKVSKIIGLDFCGIDILFGKDNEPIFCEVNSNVHFRTFFKITSIDLSEKIASYIKNSL